MILFLVLSSIFLVLVCIGLVVLLCNFIDIDIKYYDDEEDEEDEEDEND